MSVIGSNVLAGASGQAAGEFKIDRSVRLDSASSAYFSRTPSSAGNRRTFTFSCWLKRSELGTLQGILSTGTGASDYTSLYFQTDLLKLEDYTGAGIIATTAVFRDPSAWYHLVVSVDTTQATASDRVKFYINGELQVTSGTWAQNTDTRVNNSNGHRIGTLYPDGSTYTFDGYLADVYLIDGVSGLTATDFGEYDDNNVWQPKAYSGSYGTNGFYLKFDDNSSASSLGTDSSSNGNNWTVNNLSVLGSLNSNNWEAQVSTTGSTSTPSPIANIFDNSTSTYATTSVGLNQKFVLIFPAGTLENKVIRIYDINGDGGCRWSLDDSTYTYGSAGSYFTLGTGSSSQTTLYAKSFNGSYGAVFIQIEVDGKVLVNNSFALNVDSLIDTPTNYESSSGNNGGCYATFNPLYARTSTTFSNGNLQLASAAYYRSGIATISLDNGKWYYEAEILTNSANNYSMVGVTTAPENETYSGGGSGDDGFGWYSYTGALYPSGGTYSTWTTGDVVSVAYDSATRKTWIAKNGVWENSGDPAAGTGSVFTIGGTKTPFFSTATGTNGVIVANFGQRDFSYTPPTNFLPLVTTSLPEPTIADGSTAMGISTWTGNGSTQQISNLNFQTDLTWIKNRGAVSDHVLYDAIRGFNIALWPNLQDTQYDWGSDAITPDSTGFTVNRSDDRHNASSNTYVGWSWDAGENSSKTYTVKVVSDSGNKYRFDDFGTSAVTLDLEEGSTYVFDQSDSSNSGHPLRFSTTSDGTHGSGTEYTTGVTATGTPGSAGAKTTIVVASGAPTLYYYCSVHSGMGGQANTNSAAGASNFDGTIQSKVRANASAGFSIVEYGGTGSNGTFGHGLNAAPAFVMVKKYNGSDNWHVYHESVGNTKFLKLNDTTAATTKASVWNNTSPTSSVVSIGTDGGVNSSIKDFMAYCWAPVDQHSFFGKYSGNGSTDGPFVALSFRPAFLLLKRTDGAVNWLIYDNKREGYNFNNDPLYANLTATEGTTDYIDLLSNGFKIRNTHSSINASGGTYIYAAFSENAFSLNGGLAR